jgi:hypothetical protein
VMVRSGNWHEQHHINPHVTCVHDTDYHDNVHVYHYTTMLLQWPSTQT